MNAGRKGIVGDGRSRACVRLAVLWAMLTGSWNGFAQQWLSAPLESPAGQTALQPAASESIWERGVGEGFRCGAQSLTLSAGGGYGIEIFGSRESHDLALGSVSYGVMLDNTIGAGHWFRGNFELRAQLWGGWQFSPNSEWVVGLTPHLLYNFATGTRWVPFIDAGAGVTATSIRQPDLGGAFQFNLQAGLGVRRFLTDNMAVTVEASYLHISSAGIYEPNHGVNSVIGMLGISFFF